MQLQNFNIGRVVYHIFSHISQSSDSDSAISAPPPAPPAHAPAGHRTWAEMAAAARALEFGGAFEARFPTAFADLGAVDLEDAWETQNEAEQMIR